MSTLSDEKKALRLQIRRQAQALSLEYFYTSSQNILKNLLSTSLWKEAHTVLVYLSIGTEPKTSLIIQSAWKSQKRVAIPRCLPGGMMEAREIISLEGLTPKSFGILEPDISSPLIEPEKLTLVVTPCVAMDEKLHRLGHGGGYYDRYLTKVHCPDICLCHEAFMLKSIPVEPWDKPVSMGITGERIIS